MKDQLTRRKINISFTSLIWIALLGFLVYRLIAGYGTTVKEIPYSAFKTALNQGLVSSVLVSEQGISGKMSDGSEFTTIRITDPDLTKTLEANKVVI